MTPKVFFREVKAAELRAEDRLRESTTQAWQTCRIYFQTQSDKRMPKLKSLLNEIGAHGGSAKQSPAEMREVLRTMADAIGSKVRQVPA